ncbi:hypothetical protein [Companilactobacillus insicii]|uniref:hypothetical protein n=1 Tax=Companilactobacillus insicii TaxID=1732567 RepID=UPI000F782355|nr:hypothetical protein [Companilactobacillus insicii]
MTEFLTKTINAMNIPFIIRLAFNKTDDKSEDIMINTYEKMNAFLEKIDLEYSPFRDDSLVSRFQRGDKQPLLNSEAFKSVYSKSVVVGELTNGSFEVYFNGDPTKLIKSWAIEQSFNRFMVPLFENENVIGISLEGRGNAKFAVRPSTNFEWEIKTVLKTYKMRYGSISTSKINSRTKYLEKDQMDAIQELAVVGNSLVDTDIWANVGITAGTMKFTNIIRNFYLSGMLIDNQESVIFTEGILGRHQNKKGLNLDNIKEK